MRRSTLARDRTAASRAPRKGALAALALLAVLGGALRAHEHAPRDLSPHNADAYSLKTFALYERWRDLEGDAKVYEVYRYLADPRTGVYPLGVPAWEGEDDMPEFGAVRDPVDEYVELSVPGAAR